MGRLLLRAAQERTRIEVQDIERRIDDSCLRHIGGVCRKTAAFSVNLNVEIRTGTYAEYVSFECEIGARRVPELPKAPVVDK